MESKVAYRNTPRALLYNYRQGEHSGLSDNTQQPSLTRTDSKRQVTKGETLFEVISKIKDTVSRKNSIEGKISSQGVVTTRHDLFGNSSSYDFTDIPSMPSLTHARTDKKIANWQTNKEGNLKMGRNPSGWDILRDKKRRALFANIGKVLVTYKNAVRRQRSRKGEVITTSATKRGVQAPSTVRRTSSSTPGITVSTWTPVFKGKPIERFRRAAKIVRLLLRFSRSGGTDQQKIEAKFLSFSQIQEEIKEDIKQQRSDNDIDFDPEIFKAPKDHHLSSEAKHILQQDPRDRRDDHLHVAMVALKHAVDAFGEFPINMQRALVGVGWYEHFESKRIIIRQGHKAENFYFIISGTAVVTVMDKDPKTGEPYGRTVAFLGKGNSFGELALMHGGKRTATVTCKDDVELLAVGREDFIDIFMHIEKNREPEHIRFLRQVDMLQDWPLSLLPWANPKICLFTYFRRGVVMCRDSNKTDWIYIIKSGTCRILKSLDAPKPSSPLLEQKQRQPVSPRQLRVHWASPRPRREVTFISSVREKSTVQSLPAIRGASISTGGAPTRRRVQTCPQFRNSTDSRRKTGILRKEHTVTHDGDMTDHQRQLEEIFRKRHPQRIQVSTPSENNRIQAAEKQTPHKVFVQVQKLGSKDVFGLVHIAFMEFECSTSVSLVSDGAEAVLINKRFFLQHLNEDMQRKLRTSIQPYPDESTLQQKLQDQTNWDAFKAMTLKEHLLYRKFVHDTLEL